LSRYQRRHRDLHGLRCARRLRYAELGQLPVRAATESRGHDQLPERDSRELHHSDRLGGELGGFEQAAARRRGNRSCDRCRRRDAAWIREQHLHPVRAAMKLPTRSSGRLRLRQRGLTLVEMTVTILIALFLLAGLFSMVQSTRHTYTNQTQLTQLQDSER